MIPPSYLKEDSIELIMVTTSESVDKKQVKKKDQKGAGAGGKGGHGANGHDDFVEQLYSTHRLYSQMMQQQNQPVGGDPNVSDGGSPALINVAPISD